MCTHVQRNMRNICMHLSPRHQGGHLLLFALVLLLQVHVSGHPVVAAVPWQVALVLVHAPLALTHAAAG